MDKRHAPAAQRIETRLGAIECRIDGEGPALLAIHGGMGGSDQSWILARALAGARSDRRIIAVSRPGYLGTSLGLGAAPEQQADLFAALLDALGIDTASVTAVSAGGPSALHFALRHPQRCRSLILVSACTGLLQTPPKILSRLRMMALFTRVPGLLFWLRRHARRNPEVGARRAIPDPALRAATLAHPEAGALLQTLQAGVLERLADRLTGTVNDIEKFQALPPIAFNRIAVPVLMVHGKADDVVPFAHGEAAAQAIPGAALLGLDGASHVALFTHLEAIRSRAAAFL